MSFPGGAPASARGRGNGSGPRQPRPGFQGRVRGRSGANTADAHSPFPGAGPRQTTSLNTGDPPARFQLLKKKREIERKRAIRDGLLADPDKPRKLAEAITPVGTCKDKCAEFERVERMVQKDVWAQETLFDGTPDETKMVKKFRRAAAGIDEQLPSDLRPPETLRRTCDYLFDQLIGDCESLATVHHFVWDRTRAIRNDFSIQQLTKPEAVAVAIQCYERIARFHILSLHQFAGPEKPYDKYDWFQEREQLDRTLLSLMQYYDDHRKRVECKNEPEFRAYCIVFQVQDPIPDLEERVSCYPPAVRNSPRVQTALDLYSSACNILDAQGPLKPRAAHPIGREDWNAFFSKVESAQVSYLTACVAEIYFNMVRRQALNGLWRSFRRMGSNTAITDFTMDYLTDLLRFDDPDQTRDFCKHYGFAFAELPDGAEEYLDLNSVQGKVFPQASAGLSAQIFSQSVVERKRMGRTYPAVIRGYSVAQAKHEGMIVEEDDAYDQEMQMDGAVVEPKPAPTNPQQSTTTNSSFGGFGGFGNPSTASTNPFAAAQTAQATSQSPFQAEQTASQAPAQSPFAAFKPVQDSTTPAGSPFASKPVLTESVFSKPSHSAFSGFGKPAQSPWSKPLESSSTPTQTAPAASTPPFGQPTFGQTGSMTGASQFSNPAATSSASVFSQAQRTPSPDTAHAQAQNTSPSKMTSMHATTGSSWGKPAPSPWLKPVSSETEETAKSVFAPPAAASSEAPKSVFAQPAAADSGASKSVFAQPSTPSSAAQEAQPQKPLPTFSWMANSKPAEETSAAKEPPKFSFVTPSTPAAADKSSVFDQDKTSSVVKDATSKPIFDFKTAEKPFKFSLTPNAATDVPKSSFSFPSSVPAAPEAQKQDGAAKAPTFTFGAPPAKSAESTQPQAEPAKPPTFTFGAPQPAKPAETKNTSVFATPSTASSQQAAKPFVFTAPTPSAPAAEQPKTQVPPTTPAAPSNANAPPAGSQKTALPKFSNLNQPKKRSPLSQSFSVEEDQPPSPSTNKTESFETPAKGAASTTPPTTPPEPTKPDLSSILERLADEMMLDEERGLLMQFISYHARPVILSVYEELYDEEMVELAGKYRQERLAKKYGRRWRETAWKLRLQRQGREKRERRRQGRQVSQQLETSKKRRLEEDAVDDFLKRRSVRIQQEAVERTPSTNGTSPPQRHSTEIIRSGEMEPEQPEPAAASDTVGDEIDAGVMGSPDASATPMPSQNSILKRSHFLGFSSDKQRSVLGNAIPRQPSRSTYFRMKAMGLNPDGTSAIASSMAKKRARDEETEATTSPPHKKSKTPPSAYAAPGRRISGESYQSSVIRTSPTNTALSYASTDIDPLLARARRARAALKQSTTSQSPQIPVYEDDGMSLASSSFRPSSSMERARQQARLHASHRSATPLSRLSGASDVPAYRYRESRFVPRENYGRAIERAREIQERRSHPPSVIVTREASLDAPLTLSASMDVHAPVTRSDTPELLRESARSSRDQTGAASDGDALFGIGKFAQQQADVEPSLISTGIFTTQPLDLGEGTDTRALDTSEYLNFGSDLTGQNSMYPDLTTSFVHDVPAASTSVDPSLAFTTNVPALEIPASISATSKTSSRDKGSRPTHNVRTRSSATKSKPSFNSFDTLADHEEAVEEDSSPVSQRTSQRQKSNDRDAHEPETLEESFATIASHASSLAALGEAPARNTRSKSRELSMSTSQRSGHLAPELMSSQHAAQQRYDLRRSPIPEVSETEAQADEKLENRSSSPEVDDSDSDEDKADREHSGEESGTDGYEEDDEENEAGSDADDEDGRSYYSDDEAPGTRVEDENMSEEEDSESDGHYSREPSRGLTALEMKQSGLVKGGTGQTAEDAFELSD